MRPDTIIGAVLIGLVVGAVARLALPGKHPIGVLATILIGLLGAFVGLFLASGFGLGDALTFVVQVAVAATLVWVYAAMQRHHRARVYRS